MPSHGKQIEVGLWPNGDEVGQEAPVQDNPAGEADEPRFRRPDTDKGRHVHVIETEDWGARPRVGAKHLHYEAFDGEGNPVVLGLGWTLGS